MNIDVDMMMRCEGQMAMGMYQHERKFLIFRFHSNIRQEVKQNSLKIRIHLLSFL